LLVQNGSIRRSKLSRPSPGPESCRQRRSSGVDGIHDRVSHGPVQLHAVALDQPQVSGEIAS
jgi:hypothetical protein